MFFKAPHKHIKSAFHCNTCKQIVKKMRKGIAAGKTWQEIIESLTDTQWEHFFLNRTMLVETALYKQQCNQCKAIHDINAECPFCPSYKREYVYRRQPDPQPQRTPDPQPVVEQVVVADNRRASQQMIDSLYRRADKEDYKGNHKLADHLRHEARKREAAGTAV